MKGKMVPIILALSPYMASIRMTGTVAENAEECPLWTVNSIGSCLCVGSYHLIIRRESSSSFRLVILRFQFGIALASRAGHPL